MIPARVRQIIVATGVAASVVLLCLLAFDRGAGVAFAVTTAWMLANLVIWTVVVQVVIQPEAQKNGLLTIALAITAKVVLLLGGVVALMILSPYTRMQLLGIVGGVSSVLIVAFLKAAGSKVAEVLKTPRAEAERTGAAKV